MSGEHASPERVRLTLATEQAAEWFLRAQSKTVATTERHRYVAWLKRSPEHIAAALRVGQLYALLRSARPLRGPAPDERSNVVKLRPLREARVRAAPVAARSRRLGILLIAVLAALLAASILAMLRLGLARTGGIDAREGHGFALVQRCDTGRLQARAAAAGSIQWG